MPWIWGILRKETIVRQKGNLSGNLRKWVTERNRSLVVTPLGDCDKKNLELKTLPS